MALWYVDPLTFDSTSEANLSGTYQDIYIKPVGDAGTYGSAYLDKSNFKIGGATETDGSGVATAGTNIWEGGNVDIGITKVEFSNTLEGDPENHVKVRVTFGTVAPAADATFYIDIDEKTDNPVATVTAKNVCFFMEVPYDTQYIHEFYTPASSETAGWTVQSSFGGGNITKTLVNNSTFATDGYYRYKFSGSVQDYDPDALYNITQVLIRRANDGVAIDPLPGAGAPVFTTYDWFFMEALTQFNANNSSSNNIDLDIQSNATFYNNNTGTSQNFAVGYDVSIDPGDELTISYYQTLNGICSLGNTMTLVVKHFDPPSNPSDPQDDFPDIKSVNASSDIGSYAGYEDIIVRGSQGARYILHFYETTSLTSSSVKASGTPYYSFVGQGGFVADRSTKVHTIGSSKKNTHRVKVPKQSTDKRYELFVEPVSNTITKANVPTKAGDKRSVVPAIKKITMQAAVETANNWDITGSTFSFGRKSTVTNYKHTSTTAEASATISSKTRLVIKERNNDIKVGMYVIAPFTGGSSAGIPHKTTVKSIKGDVITLSAASSIAADTILRFESQSSRIIPYSITILAGTGSDSDYQDMAINGTYRPEEIIAGLTERLQCTLSSQTSNANTIVCNNAASLVGQIQVGMLVESSAMTTTSGNSTVKVTAVTPSTKTITVDENVSIANSSVITIRKDTSLGTPVTTRGINNIHTQADMARDGVAAHGGTASGNQESATISGYLEVENNISNSATLTVRVDNALTSTETATP